jgi:hypothetical protein
MHTDEIMQSLTPKQIIEAYEKPVILVTAPGPMQSISIDLNGGITIIDESADKERV